MHKTSLFVLLALLLVAIGGWAVWSRFHAPVVSTTIATTQYSSSETRLAFVYKNTYVLDVRQDSFNGHEVTVLTLTNPTIVVPDMSDGPGGISVLVVADAANTPLALWLQQSSISNFNLSTTKELASTTLAGQEALRYTYSGLYENDAVATMHNGKKYLFFGAWGTAGDPTRKDLQDLLKTVQFI